MLVLNVCIEILLINFDSNVLFMSDWMVLFMYLYILSTNPIMHGLLLIEKNFVTRQTFSATFHFHITLYLLIYWKYWIHSKAFIDCSTANFNLSSFLLDSADCAKMVFIVFSRRQTLKYLYLTLDKSNF